MHVSTILRTIPLATGAGTLSVFAFGLTLSIADRILGALDVRDSRLADLRDAVETRKSGGMSDESIIERLVSDIRTGVDDDELDTYE